MRIPENSKSETVSINKYKNFGLREKADSLWVSTLVERRDQFFPWNESHPLGNKMVEACVPWFRQAYLTGKDKKVTPLVDLFEKQGGGSEIGWEFIWMSLANNAFLIKWFITATDVNTLYSTEKLMSISKTCVAGLSISCITQTAISLSMAAKSIFLEVCLYRLGTLKAKCSCTGLI